jgi:serine protease
MKIKSIITALGLIASMSAAAENSYLIVKTKVMDDLQQPWVISSQNISDRFVRIEIAANDTAYAYNFIESLGYDVDVDTPFISRDVTQEEFVSVDGVTDEQGFSFNDPRYSSQQFFRTAQNQIASGISYQRERNAEINILIVDSGVIAHEDLSFAGGYNFASLIETGRDPENYADLTIQSDGTTCSDGHGIEMAGIIGAVQNNGVGITGISNANLYMARVVEKDCSTGNDVGSLSNITDALEEVSSDGNAGGFPVPDVVNISLASETPCPASLQAAIDVLVEQGTSIVVSAGNFSAESSSYAPANCRNVVVVGSHTSTSNSSSFSNTGANVDITMPATLDTTLLNNNYGASTGTSVSAAAATGVIAVVKQMFPDATPNQIEYLLKASSTPYPSNSTCINSCGEGMGNLFALLEASEKTLDPQLSFSHPMVESGQCRVTREVESILPFVDVCAILNGNIQVDYIEGDNPVAYNIEFLSRPNASQSWEGPNVKVIHTYSPELSLDSTPVADLDFDNNDYGIVACFENGRGERVCPYVQELNTNTVTFPLSCF